MHQLISIPVKVISEQSAKGGWRKSGLRHKAQKTMTKFYLKNARFPTSLPVEVTLIRVSSHKLDSDNLQYAFKWVRDAVADYLIPGKAAGRADDDPRIEWRYDQRKGPPGIEILFSYLGET